MSGPGDVFWAVVVILGVIALGVVFTLEMRRSRHLASRRVRRDMARQITPPARPVFRCAHLDRLTIQTFNPARGPRDLWVCLTCGDTGTDTAPPG